MLDFYAAAAKARVTGWVYEKITQNVAQPFFVEINK
jgi:hypothetical protein